MIAFLDSSLHGSCPCGISRQSGAKMIAFLDSSLHRRVRTNNHVEGMKRGLRQFEKSRDKWQRARTKVRLVILLLERGWGGRTGQLR
jgi:hypothetical protein